METIYYLSTIIFIIIELGFLLSPIEKTNQTKRFNELTKEFKGKKSDEYSKEYKKLINTKLWLLWVLIWLFIGLFTSQWVIFLTWIIFNFGIISPILRLTRYSLIYTVIVWVNSLMGVLFGLFVIINHYHLKIDLTSLFMSLIK